MIWTNLFVAVIYQGIWLTEALKVKGVSMNRNMTCSSPIEALYYRSTNLEPIICALCSKPLNEDLKKRLASKKETHSTIQPNCGEHCCLLRNAGGENGWTIQRAITKRRKPKPKLMPKPNTKAHKRKRTPGGSPSGKKRKTREFKQTALKKFMSLLNWLLYNENNEIQ